jgi:hypothetical protein
MNRRINKKIVWRADEKSIENNYFGDLEILNAGDYENVTDV